MSEARRAALRARVAALSPSARAALAEALAADGGAGGASQLVAFVVPERESAAGRPPEPPTDEALRAFLAERLPAYMVPVRFAALPRLPRTAAGKLDRRALAHERGTELAAPGRALVAPRTPVEATLAGIWKEVLRLDEIGVHDDFFEIGGDSLLSIRVIARAGRAGIRIPVERFFDNPTIAQLAAAVEAPASPAADEATRRDGEGEATGDAPLTPIQHWFLDAVPEHRDHWNQAVLLELAPAIGRDAVDAALRALVEHHDALRLRLAERDGGRRQEFLPPSDGVPLRVVTLDGDDPSRRAAIVADEADREHRSLRLGEGSLFRGVLFEGAGGWRRLLLVAHHVVVDDVSWDVLLEDVVALLVAATRGDPLRLPARTASARAWSIALAREAAAPRTAASASYWLALGAPTRMLVDDGDAEQENRVGDAAVHRLALGGDAASRLADAARRLDATPQALLLASLLLAWREWSGQEDLLLDVEGHGRDVLGDALDVSRTVGWFTTVFPVRLAARRSAAAAPPPADVVRAVQATLAGLPARGAAHGLLRWLSPDEATRAALAARGRPQLLFNYLGVRRAPFAADAPVRLAAEPHGRARSPDAPRAYVLEINARVEAEHVVLDVEYSRRLHRARSVERFGEALRTALQSVLETRPAPFALAAIGADELSRVAALLAEVDDA